MRRPWPGTLPGRYPTSWCLGPCGPWRLPGGKRWWPPAAWPPTPLSAPTCMPPAAKAGVRLFLPPLKWCGDNGAMIGAQGYYEYLAGHTAALDLNAYATMDLGAPLL